MTWFVLALLTAFFVASQDTWVKKYFSQTSVWDMIAFPLFYGLPLFLVVLFFVPFPKLDRTFYWSFLLSLPINGLGMIFYMKAIQISPLSLTIPYLAFTPTFMIPVGYLLLEELPDTWGVVGILVTCAGSYVLNMEKDHRSLLAPFKAIGREAGSLLMLFVAFVYSFGAVVGKIAILHSSPLFFGVSFFFVFSLVILLPLFAFRKIQLPALVREYKKGVVVGILYFFHIYCHSYAISMVKAAYMISIKRFSILFSLVYGRLVFQEKNIAVRLAGSLLMISGAMLIVLAGR